MSGTFAVKEEVSFVAPGKQVTFDLGEVIEGHISIALSAVEDPDLHQTLVPGNSSSNCCGMGAFSLHPDN
jgi:hypothetical protein